MTICQFPGCIQRQQEFQAKPKVDLPKAEEKVVEITHEENEWGIELVSEDVKEPATTSGQTSTGLKLAYEPAATTHSTVTSEQKAATDEVSLEDLMAQMKNM